MSEKYIVFGATGSIGSRLAEQLVSSGNKVHLVARNEAELKIISEKLGCTSTVADVLKMDLLIKLKYDF
jgi:short-subunit dehydrogenase